MHLAVISNSSNALNSLLEAKASTEAKDNDGFVALSVLSSRAILCDCKIMEHYIYWCIKVVALTKTI